MERDIQNFLAELASKAPVPGGGGAAALCGALGIALGNMVGSLTVGKRKYADVEEEMRALNGRAERLRGEFLALIDADAEALRAAEPGLCHTQGRAGARGVMERALLRAAGPPMEIMRRCAEALELIGEYAAKGSALAVSDAGCAAALCLAAMRAAVLNVLINTKGMADREAAGRLNSEALSLLAEYGGTAEEIYENITGRLS